MLKTRHVLLAKAETTYNTDPTPTAGSNAILVENLAYSYAGARAADRSGAVKPGLVPLKNLYAGSLLEVTFDVEIKGSGSAGTAPAFGPLLLACGLEETIVAATSVQYNPASDPADHGSVTIWLYEDGIRYKITGCRGSFTMSLQTAQVGKISFRMVGHLSNRADASLVTPTLSSVVPPVLVGVPFEIDSYQAVITKFELDPGITVATPDNIASSDGYGDVRITGHAPTFTIDPEATVLATYDWVTKWQANTAVVIAVGTIGSTAGNRYALGAAGAVYSEVGNGDRDGIITREIKGQLTDSGGTDNAWGITFT